MTKKCPYTKYAEKILTLTNKISISYPLKRMSILAQKIVMHRFIHNIHKNCEQNILWVTGCESE